MHNASHCCAVCGGAADSAGALLCCTGCSKRAHAECVDARAQTWTCDLCAISSDSESGDSSDSDSSSSSSHAKKRRKKRRKQRKDKSESRKKFDKVKKKKRKGRKERQKRKRRNKEDKEKICSKRPKHAADRLPVANVTSHGAGRLLQGVVDDLDDFDKQNMIEQARNERRKQIKEWRKQQDALLDELAPKPEAGSHAALREARAIKGAYARARDDGGGLQDFSEDTLMGGGDDFTSMCVRMPCQM
eukprot:SAG31_NODE_2862_length_4983_cov_6.264742_2_plen_246_part_00